VDGNTDDKKVQDTFIGTLMETMKGGNFPVFQEDMDVVVNDDGTMLQDQERQMAAVGPTSNELSSEQRRSPVAIAGITVPHQHGYIPNNTNNMNTNHINNNNNNNQEQQMRYNVRNMYAQIGSYPNDSVL
jgi:hypothetical protein